MILKIEYRKIAIKFINKNQIYKNDIDELISKSIKKIYKIEDSNIDIKKMKASDFFRIRKGNMRIIFSHINQNEVIISLVENIDFRGNIY